MADQVFRLQLGNSIEVLKEFADNSFDSVVTDPPYGLEFMGREFDGANGFRRSLNKADVERPNGFGRTSRTSPEYRLSTLFQEFTQAWATEVLRVLKPGGHLLAFGGSRTYHRLASGIEDAGFEVRDQISYYCSNDEQKEAFFNGLSPDQREQFLNAFGRPSTIDYVYGSGFPKSLNVGKAINKAAHGFPQGGPDPTSPNHGKYKGGCSEDNPAGRGFGAGPGQFMAEPGVTEEPSDLVHEAVPWLGFGSALKPAHEPIVVARKPLVGTIVQNVLKYGTGAINIDGCRVGTTKDVPASVSHNKGTRCMGKYGIETGQEPGHNPDVGRFPANVIHDGSDEVLAVFPNAPGALAPVKGTEPSSVTKNTYGARQRVPFNTREGEASANRRYTEEGGTNFAALPGERRFDKGSAARFFKACPLDEPTSLFYCAKASKKERGPGNDWPTVKPLALMRYLVRLVTPPGGLVLDPFVGSGTTGLAAIQEGFRFEGIDSDQHALDIAHQRFKDLMAKTVEEKDETNL